MKKTICVLVLGLFLIQLKFASAVYSQSATPIDVYLSSSNHPFKGVGWNINSAKSNLIQALDDSTVQFIRVGFTPDSYQPTANTTAYDSDAANQTISLLQHAKQKNITVMLTNWDSGGKYDNYYSSCQLPGCTTAWPDHPYWLSSISQTDPGNTQNRFCHLNYAGDPGICSDAQKISRQNIKGVESDQPYDATVFAQTVVNFVSYMVNQKSARVDFLSLWNEPAGDWSYHPRDSTKKYPSSFTDLYKAVSLQLQQSGLQSIKLVGMDDVFSSGYPATSIVNFALANWNSYVSAFSLHNYDGTVGSTGDIQNLYSKAAGKPIIIGEVGHKGTNGCDDGGSNPWGNSIESTRLMISDARHGAYALARWWLADDGNTDCWAALNGNAPVSPTFNSLRVLSNSLPQINQDISVVNSKLPDFDSNFDAVVINAAPSGISPVVWAVNKNTSDRPISLRFNGLTKAVVFKTSFVTGVAPYTIQSGPQYSASPSVPTVNFTIPSNTIFVAQTLTSVPTPAPKPGDLNGDGKVDINDYNILMANFGKTGTGIVGDIDGNGVVDIYDYGIFLGNFGK